jgi:hypothetical protein
MAAVIELVPDDERGTELLDELERRTQELPYKTNTRTGARTYSLQSADTDGFDAILDRIDPDWREHLSRTP